MRQARLKSNFLIRLAQILEERTDLFLEIRPYLTQSVENPEILTRTDDQIIRKIKLDYEQDMILEKL